MNNEMRNIKIQVALAALFYICMILVFVVRDYHLLP
jgi:hypothetical protein